MIELLVINALVRAGVYSILAIGFSLVFSVARILNMAHTAFFMMAAFLLYFAISKLGIPFLLATFSIIILMGLFGLVVYRLLFDRVKAHQTATMMISFSLAILIQEVVKGIYSTQVHRIPPFISGFVQILNTRVSWQNVLVFCVSIGVIILIWILLKKTRWGNVIRAIADDIEIANLMGIDVGRMCSITVGISASLAAIAGILVGPLYMVEPNMWLSPFIIILAICVLGGMGSIKGAVIGSLILASVESVVIFLVPEGAYFKDGVALSVMIFMLLLRPEGIFGIVFEEERLL